MFHTPSCQKVLSSRGNEHRGIVRGDVLGDSMDGEEPAELCDQAGSVVPGELQHREPVAEPVCYCQISFVHLEKIHRQLSQWN